MVDAGSVKRERNRSIKVERSSVEALLGEHPENEGVSKSHGARLGNKKVRGGSSSSSSRRDGPLGSQPFCSREEVRRPLVSDRQASLDVVASRLHGRHVRSQLLEFLDLPQEEGGRRRDEGGGRRRAREHREGRGGRGRQGDCRVASQYAVRRSGAKPSGVLENDQGEEETRVKQIGRWSLTALVPTLASRMSPPPPDSSSRVDGEAFGVKKVRTHRVDVSKRVEERSAASRQPLFGVLP